MSKIKPNQLVTVCVGVVGAGKSYSHPQYVSERFNQITPTLEKKEMEAFIKNIDRQITHVSIHYLKSFYKFEFYNQKVPLLKVINGHLVRSSWYYRTNKRSIGIIITVFIHNVKKEFHLPNLNSVNISKELISQIKSWLFLRKYDLK